MKLVGLLDCNNFFVSCERLFRPDLKKWPTVVLSSNDGVVVARSQEVKDLGIPMGTPLHLLSRDFALDFNISGKNKSFGNIFNSKSSTSAKRNERDNRCPGKPHFKVKDELKANQVAVFSSNFQLYRDISHRVMDVLQSEIENVEQYSVDEAFFELNAKNENAARAELARLKQVIEKQVGVPVSLGAGKTMTIAKYASELGKKNSGACPNTHFPVPQVVSKENSQRTDKERVLFVPGGGISKTHNNVKMGVGVCVLVGESWQKITPEIDVSEIWGIGGQTSIKMRQHGIITVADLLAADRARVEKLFGVHGLRLRSELFETPAHDIHERHGLQKSIMSTRSFAKTTTSLSVLEDAVAYHIGEAGKELRGIGGRAKSLRVLIRTSRHSDFFLRDASDEVILPEATSDTRILLREALALTKKLYQPDTPYKKAGVALSRIESADGLQLNLFQNVEEKTGAETLMNVVDELNEKLGKDSVTIGRVRDAGVWKASRQYSSPRYTTSWSELASVKA